jgi:integrase
MPLSPEEYENLLRAIDTTFPEPGRRVQVRALIQLMRWSGLAIRDALTLRRASFQVDRAGNYRVVTKRQKTGVDVSVPLPEKVGADILAAHNDNALYLFWDGETDIVKSWTKYVIAPLFKGAEVEKVGNMVSHRLRDTFAVDLLEKGLPMEELSKLLGHESIKTTERSYAKWVKGRQDRLDALVRATWEG